MAAGSYSRQGGVPFCPFITGVLLGVVYTSTKAVLQAVAQQICRANGRFELFSSLLTPRTFELRGQQTAESSGYK